MRVYLDTNALIAALESADQVADLVRQILQSADRADMRFVSNELTLGKLLVHPLRDNDRESAENLLSLFASAETLEAVPIDRRMVIEAADLRARYASLKLADAIHLATALRSDCSDFLSNDYRLPRLATLDFVHLNEGRLQKLLHEIDLAP